MTPELMDLKDLLYKAIGGIIFVNFGTIVTFGFWIVKQAYKSGYEKATIDLQLKDAKDCAVRAHKRDDEQDKELKDHGKRISGIEARI